MCGIVGYIGKQSAADIIFDGLTRLEYRGYDSAGIATLHQNKTEICRAEGKLKQLKSKLQKNALPGNVGIGHTRWATHGKPNEQNAHPHHYGLFTVVHNGIIENYLELKEALQKKKHVFSSDTDTEILAHLMNEEFQQTKSSFKALQNILKRVRGSYALAILNEKETQQVLVARNQSPLVLGEGLGENFIASDVPALLPYTREVIFLKDGEIAVLQPDKIEVFNNEGHTVNFETKHIDWSLTQAEKEGYKHFMLKEIFEGPRAFIDTLRGKVPADHSEILLEDFKKTIDQYPPELIYLVACGTSYHAALVGKFYLEKWARIPVVVDVASEFRYRKPILNSKTLLIVISQSGETADTLTVVKSAKLQKAPVYAICNVLESSIAREANGVFYTHAGPEIGVAATKTFLTQLQALLLVSLCWADHQNKISKEALKTILQETAELPQKMELVLKQAEEIKKLALHYMNSNLFLFIGRGLLYPIALEAALKLKEISYIFAEGYAGGELKHGPIAMIDQGTPVIALVPQDESYEKMSSNIQEVLARGAEVLAICNEQEKSLKQKCKAVIEIPKTLDLFYPLLAIIPLQLFAYHIANEKGHDVDQPRNLAKSVTVE
ncbi:MAG: glutamine--fructose-6-phosphate transaminase (isomerizing) [Deltaproteobacteria bacterium]|nr:glutamine--fructose-6-phosphate transaminase (isomerizing) [Deltaproteobacteria bacterium]